MTRSILGGDEEPNSGLKVNQLRSLLQIDIGLRQEVTENLLAGFREADRTEEAILCLMITLCPGLSTLVFHGQITYIRDLKRLDEILWCICDDLYGHDGSPRAADQVAVANRCGLYTIHSIELHDNNTDSDGLGVQDLAILRRFPQVHTMFAENVKDSKGYGLHESRHRSTSALRTLTISCFTGRVEELSFLISRCSNLRSIEIEWCIRENNFWRLDWGDLGWTIGENCPLLENLRLDHLCDPLVETEDFRVFCGAVENRYMRQTHLPGLGSLQELTCLKTLTLSRIALFGSHGDDVFPDEDYWSDDEVPPKHTLETLLPSSLSNLTVLCENFDLSYNDKALIDDPRAATLDNLTVFNCNKTLWASKKEGSKTKSIQHCAKSSTSTREELYDEYNIPQDFDTLMDVLDEEQLEAFAAMPDSTQQAVFASLAWQTNQFQEHSSNHTDY